MAGSVSAMADDTTEGVHEALDAVAHSSAMERVAELAFLSELVQEAWFVRRQIVDVLHSSVDAFGHDVVLECGRVLRHVQLKTRRVGGKTSAYKINLNLGDRPSGCVIVLDWQHDAESNRVTFTYRWFGGPPGEPLPPLGDKIAKHSKGNAKGEKLARPNLRVVPLTKFTKVPTIADLLTHLFGP
jgi:hypothetical protein